MIGVAFTQNFMGFQSFTELLLMYKPLLLRESVVEGIFDEDLYQELCYRFICCIDKFDI